MTENLSVRNSVYVSQSARRARRCSTVVMVVRKSIGNGHFLDAAAEKPLNRLRFSDSDLLNERMV